MKTAVAEPAHQASTGKRSATDILSFQVAFSTIMSHEIKVKVCLFDIDFNELNWSVLVNGGLVTTHPHLNVLH